MSQLGRFSLRRNPLSYTKVHVLLNDQLRVASLWRNRRFLINRRRIAGREYLSIGGGYNIYPGFVNLDYRWHPGVDVTWDIQRTRKFPYPFHDETFKGIYTEHCLEHIDQAACADNLREFMRILRPGGIVRIIVPDGELYIDWYNRHRRGERVEIYRARELGEATPMVSINRVARRGHQFLYDYETFAIMLRDARFTPVTRVEFRKGSDPMLLRDSERRRIESLYLEAKKPA